MTHLLAKGSDPSLLEFLGILVFAFIGFLLLAGLVALIREAIVPKQVGHRMKRFFGPDLKLLQAHEKTFPGWDLGSLSRAVASFVDECCERSERLGSFALASSIQPLIPSEQEGRITSSKVTALTYERLPVDVDRDESFVSNALYFATVRPDHAARAKAATGRVSTAEFTLGPRSASAGAEPRAGRAGERVAIFLAQDKEPGPTLDAHGHLDDEGLAGGPPAPVTRVLLSIACRSRDIADFFFAEIERRRQSLSVYRGKVIEPVITRGGVQSVGFRKLQPTREQDLELPTHVKQLIDSSILAFYESAPALRALGVELKRGVLFHSPPGTGKTSICRYLAGRLPNFTVCFVSGRRLLFPRELCRMARYLQPTMLVFEDIDLIAQERDHNGLATILGELMNQIDECEPAEQVLFVMNTNSLDRIERAVRDRAGRVDQIIDLPLPDEPARARLLRLFAKSTAPAEADLARVAAATHGATPATLKEVVKRAAVMAVRGSAHATRATTASPPTIQITAADLLLAYEQVGRLRGPEA